MPNNLKLIILRKFSYSKKFAGEVAVFFCMSKFTKQELLQE